MWGRSPSFGEKVQPSGRLTYVSPSSDASHGNPNGVGMSAGLSIRVDRSGFQRSRATARSG